MLAYDKQYINGKWCYGTSDIIMENRNPFNGELLYTYKAASRRDVDDAYNSAQNAQVKWSETLPDQKINLLEKLSDIIDEMSNEMAECMLKEGGSTVPKIAFEIHTSKTIVRQAMSYPYFMQGKIIPSDIPGKDNYIFKKPKGVISVIVPWNVPFVLAMRSVVPAIATGNTVVLKPSSETPASAFIICKMFEKAGFPEGVINAVSGKSSEIGDYFVEHPIPSLISFTGSTKVGQRVGSKACEKMKDVSLELGGNNVMIVLEDADINKAVKAACFGAFFHQGQVCMALNRIIIVKERYDEFIKEFIVAVQKLPVGDPANPNTFIGPIINKEQIKGIEQLIEGTKKTGAKVVLEGKTEGNLIYPWVFADCTNDMPACANEIFAPVISLIKAKDEEEAVKIGNDTIYGLSGSVFTENLYHGIEIANKIESGMAHVNDQSINDEPQVMFGGEKYSGIGRFNAQWVVNKFTTEKWISVQKTPRF